MYLLTFIFIDALRNIDMNIDKSDIQTQIIQDRANILKSDVWKFYSNIS